MNYVERIVAKQQRQYHKEIYVDYRKQAIIAKLKKHELENMLDWLIASGYTFNKHTTLKALIPPKSYSLTYNDHLIKLSYYDGKKYYWYTTNYHDDTKNLDTPNSFKAFKLMFKKRTGVNLLKAFGRTTQFYKKFCPKPLYYISSRWDKYKWIEGISKEDFVSHYPYTSTLALPDANTAKEVDKYVLPDEEYKYAYYPDSGHVAVYGEFDSHEWIPEIRAFSAQVKLKTAFLANYKAKDHKTILMKESPYSIKDEILYFFNIKAAAPKDSVEHNDAKIFLLKFIGMLEQVNPIIYASYPFAHLAAVIKWRANIKMFKTLREIGYNNVIQVCVDGVIHAGKAVGSKTNKLGELNIEVENAKFIQRGLNQYILKNETFKEVKHVGLDVNIDSGNIMTWLASNKINFIQYIKDHYQIEEKL